MKKSSVIKIAAALAVLLTMASCGVQQKDDRTVINEPDKIITVIDNENTETDTPLISVDKIVKYEGAEITGWLDEETVVLAKENTDLGKMSLLEVSDYYPRSLYLYNLDTDEYKTVKVRKNMFLGGAVLSPDKKHLLYYEYSIGDTAHYLMSMDDGAETSVKDEALGIAITADWVDSQSVIGVSYAGGAYSADIDGDLTQIAELQDEQLYTVRKAQDKIYYITIDGSMDLFMLDMATKEKKNLNLKNADGIIPSPDGTQILVTQWAGPEKSLLVADSDGNVVRTIAEGTDITAAAWSPDQRMIAYQLNSVVDGAAGSGLYLYDVITGKSIQIAVNITNAKISWSPSGKRIAVAEMGEKGYNSSVIYLK